MGFKLEWTPPGAKKPLTMIYSSDTKPEWNSILHAINRDLKGIPQGVDVFIHEMAVAPEIWAMKNQGLSEPGSGDTWDATVAGMQTVQNSSHTPQGAFGYMLSQINKVKPPRLAVATHFPTADDTVACALESVQRHCPGIRCEGEQLVWSFDLMVIRVFPNRIEQRRAVVNDFSFNPPIPANPDKVMYAPKYHDANGAGDPFAQIDMDGQTAVAILPTEQGGFHGQPTFDEDGY
jgi:ribonuclease Z